jgi:hypothetical protein
MFVKSYIQSLPLGIAMPLLKGKKQIRKKRNIMEITADLQRQIDEYENNRIHRAPMSDELKVYLDEQWRAEAKAKQDRINEEKRLRDEHEQKKAKVASAIHELIVESDLSVFDAAMILKEAIRRVEMCSQVTAIDWNKLNGCMSF